MPEVVFVSGSPRMIAVQASDKSQQILTFGQ